MTGPSRERPILFSAPMVRAIMEGRKTQTRRVVKPIPPRGLTPNHCRYGVPGDRLWVRETWAHVFGHEEYESWEMPHIKSFVVDNYLTGSIPAGKPANGDTVYAADGWDDYVENGDFRWRPSIHMPRWASRITLDVVDVRVQLLQDITQEDAGAEGVRSREEFHALWESINGAGSWDANPWVWAVTFKRVSP